MWPGDLKMIGYRLNDLPTSARFAPGTRPFIYQEVLESGNCHQSVSMKFFID
jgi:hypothetical protein